MLVSLLFKDSSTSSGIPAILITDSKVCSGKFVSTSSVCPSKSISPSNVRFTKPITIRSSIVRLLNPVSAFGSNVPPSNSLIDNKVFPEKSFSASNVCLSKPICRTILT